MRIANIILTSQNGGVEQVFIDYLSIFKDLGHDVLAIVKKDAPYFDKVLDLDIEVKKISNNFGYYDIFAARNIRRILREFKADTIFAHIGKSAIIVKRAIKNEDIILVSINHSGNVKRSIGSDLVLSVNKEIFYKTIDAGQPADKSLVMPNAIDLSDIDEVYKKDNLENKEVIIIGTMARIDKFKGLDILINSIKKLQNISDKKIILKIAGKGEEEDNLKRLVTELNLENSIEFCGWIKDKKQFFDSIDIFCLPSKGETFGLVILEAIKYRKPVVSTACDGPKEIIKDGVEGLLLDLKPINNLDDRIAHAIIKIIEDEELRDNIIKNSFKKLKEEFSYESLKNRLQEVVGSCAKSHL